ncbi:sigma-54-dependent transcriptional regulator [Pontiella agarivorans]|uniref:Sigma-54 dependent transcriptional regulator n=1 Tax=Pontiella agarivorans TaxID=3038953 RepID=A0ABU5MYX7_9BACT|nr:sigma-54 dependent transcriptional regulator [Pontiella agarivorans]MDZ8119383.1 sigma-54 dependent transcriptional regulator [Pontiella agarivorans]
MAKILIADDDPTILSLLNKILLSKGYEVQLAEHGGVAEKLLKSEQFDLLISDIKMEPVDGMQLLKRTRQLRPHVGAIMLTAYATVATAVEAMKEGAFDYIPKPFKIDELLETVKRALEYQKSLSEQIGGDGHIEAKKYFGNIVAESEQMINVCEMIKRVAPTKTTIMISGESGTGKELVAEAVHSFSARSEGPFLPVNCAALPETLIESELFGHTRGAFTGANADKKGLFEAARGGTLFLDEINSIPHSLQSKLLRAIQNKKIRKVGGTEEFDVDVRILAASNRNLENMVKEGTFREDLFYRLSVISIDIPPLKTRPEDVLPLAQHFISHELEPGEEFPAMDNTVLGILQSYSWPGNVRELQNVIQHCLTFLHDGKITKETLPSKLIVSYEENPAAQQKAALTGGFEKGKSLKAFLRAKEKEYLKTVIDTMGGDKVAAAKELDISLATLYRKLPEEEQDS